MSSFPLNSNRANVHICAQTQQQHYPTQQFLKAVDNLPSPFLSQETRNWPGQSSDIQSNPIPHSNKDKLTMMQPPPPPPPPPRVEVMELNASSSAAQQQHQQMLLDLQARRMASSMDVPTLPDAVRTALRDLQCPVRLFGENLANVRDRLRLELAKRHVYREHYGGNEAGIMGMVPPSEEGFGGISPRQPEKEAPQETQYTRASPALIAAREKLATFSLVKAQQRLEEERRTRLSYKALQKKRKTLSQDENTDTSNTSSPPALLAETLDQSCCTMYQSLQNATLAGSQYGDVRPLSAICTYNDKGGSSSVFTASWSATLQWWDGNSPTLDLLGRQRQAHEDRIMGVALQTTNGGDKIMAGTASIDLTAKLWTIGESTNTADTDMEDTTSTTVSTKKQEDTDDDANLPIHFTEVAHLKGHEARLCKIAFHPQGDWVATTSHDHTWRLWDIETLCSSSSSTESSELLLQDGHAREVFGIDFHPDGSLCATTDYSGMIHVWDLRTGKTTMQYHGHAGRVLCAKFAPVNGFQLTTAGDDGCLKVWDLRHRRKTQKSGSAGCPDPRRTIPAHSKLISELEYSDNDECLVSSSFDGTAKIWSTRGDWKLLQTLEGHEGKVMGLGIVSTYNDDGKQKQHQHNAAISRDWGVVTCGFDKTLKLWH